jgi:hypothetical protein
VKQMAAKALKVPPGVPQNRAAGGADLCRTVFIFIDRYLDLQHSRALKPKCPFEFTT